MIMILFVRVDSTKSDLAVDERINGSSSTVTRLDSMRQCFKQRDMRVSRDRCVPLITIGGDVSWLFSPNLRSPFPCLSLPLLGPFSSSLHSLSTASEVTVGWYFHQSLSNQCVPSSRTRHQSTPPSRRHAEFLRWRHEFLEYKGLGVGSENGLKK